MSRSLTWLHLSDLHARVRDDWDARPITDALVRDLAVLQKDFGLRPDLIFFTGDAAFGAAGGENMAEQYKQVRAFLESIRRIFSPEVPSRNIYLVPGNHDVDRSEVTPDQTSWLRAPSRSLADILTAMRDGKKQWRTWMERLGAYRNFVTSYGLLHLQPENPYLVWSDAQEINGVRFGVSGLNSAWSAVDDEDKAKLWLGLDWQVAQAKKDMGPVAFSFALIHHPGNWFTDREDPRIVRRLRQEFEVVLHGHEHQEWVDQDADHKLVLSAGACYESSWMANGYSVGQLDFDAKRGRVWLRQWDSIGRGWVPRNIAGKTENGIWSLPDLPWLQATAVVPDAVIVGARLDADASQGIAGDPGPEETYTRRFCNHVVYQHDTLELFGCDIPRELQRHQLSVAYVSLNLSPESKQELPSGPLEKRPVDVADVGDADPEIEGVDETAAIGRGIEGILDGVDRGSGRLMISGPAGAGKSTLLRWCAIHAAQSVLSGNPGAPVTLDGTAKQENNDLVLVAQRESSWRTKVPFLVRLRECPDGRLPPAVNLPRFLAKHLPVAPGDWMTDLLTAGNVLLLFDGVDEIHRDHRSKLAEEIGELIGTYPACTYVVTTRPGAVERGWLDRLKFVEARVEPMGRKDRDEFIEKWYRSAALELKGRPRPGEDLSLTAIRLRNELTDQPELGLLASNPLLCAMICALYRERQERLPETPSELCEALVQMLLHRRERETPGLQDAHFLATWRALQYSQKKGLLAEIAWQLVSSGVSSIESVDAKTIVGRVLISTPSRKKDEAPEVFEALVERSGLLRPASDERVEFLHNTLKEYLAATRAVESNSWKLLARRADDPAWQPVILFALALASESFSSSLVRDVLTRFSVGAVRRKAGALTKREQHALAKSNARDFFLVRCRRAAKRLAADLSEKIDGLTSRLFPPAYMHDVEALAQLGPRIFLHGAARLLEGKWWSRQDARVAARCLRLLRLIGGEKAAAALGSITALPSHSSLLTAEWMAACSELADSSLPWPFVGASTLWLENMRVNDLRPLATATSLRYVALSGTQVEDLSPVASNQGLHSLEARRTKVAELSPLAEITSLRRLLLDGTLVSNLSHLKKLTSLRHLSINDTQVSDLGPIAELRELEHLSMSRTRVRDLSALDKMRALRVLICAGVGKVNVSPIRDVTSLQELDLSGNHLDAVQEMSGLVLLRKVRLDHAVVDDIGFVRNAQHIEDLFLNGTAVEDLSPLRGKENLRRLLVDRTRVSSLVPLAGMRRLSRLDLDMTGVADLEPLRQCEMLETLYLRGTKVTQLDAVAGLPNLKFIHFGRTDVSSIRGLASLESLRMLEVGDAVSAEEVAAFREKRADVQILRLPNVAERPS